MSSTINENNQENWQRTLYGLDVDEGWLKRAVYGMPELSREKVRRASLIANPGCYPTSTILGLVPALRASLIDTETVICDAKREYGSRNQFL